MGSIGPCNNSLVTPYRESATLALLRNPRLGLNTASPSSISNIKLSWHTMLQVLLQISQMC